MARTILTQPKFDEAVAAARAALPRSDTRTAGLADAVAAALAAVGVLTPPPEPDPETCTALFADPEGNWWQCQEDPGHDGDDHDGSDWGWSTGDPDAIPPRAADTSV